MLPVTERLVLVTIRADLLISLYKPQADKIFYYLLFRSSKYSSSTTQFSTKSLAASRSMGNIQLLYQLSIVKS